MHWDAPFRLLQAVTGDLLQKPGHCRQMMRHYLDLRSLAHGAGRLSNSCIFELLPDAAETPVVLEDQFEIPLLPLYEAGYSSIGCEPCTTLPLDPANPRSGRWGGQKLECGIHVQKAEDGRR